MDIEFGTLAEVRHPAIEVLQRALYVVSTVDPEESDGQTSPLGGGFFGEPTKEIDAVKDSGLFQVRSEHVERLWTASPTGVVKGVHGREANTFGQTHCNEDGRLAPVATDFNGDSPLRYSLGRFEEGSALRLE